MVKIARNESRNITSQQTEPLKPTEAAIRPEQPEQSSTAAAHHPLPVREDE